jgi:hypothetical protein
MWGNQHICVVDIVKSENERLIDAPDPLWLHCLLETLAMPEDKQRLIQIDKRKGEKCPRQSVPSFGLLVPLLDAFDTSVDDDILGLLWVVA